PGMDNTCMKRFDWKLGDLPEGYDHKYTYSHLGYNLKVSDMQAAVGLSQLKKLDRFVAARNNNFARLTDAMIAEGLDEHYHLPQTTPGADPSWFGYLVTIKNSARLNRREVTRQLEDRKVGTRLLFAGNLVRQPAFKGVNYRVEGPLDVTDKVMMDAFWMGVWPGIDEERVAYMVSTLKTVTEELLV
ncbi:MAG: DegT/DnrJ/EryC1/StrS family aminotransferase, partial [Pseudomonadota bacterium]